MSPRATIAQRLTEILWLYINNAKHGERLPSEPELAKKLGVSRATLREAMRAFETQGIIHRRQGSGTFVSRPKHVIETGLEVLESIETLAKRIGLSVEAANITIESRAPTAKEAEALKLETEAKVLQVSRVIMAEGAPVAYLVDVLPEDVLTEADLAEGFSGSVFDVLLRRGTPPLDSSRCEISAVNATSDLPRFMAIQRGDVLLCFESYLYDTTGRIVDYSFSYFLPGYFHFHVIRRVGSAKPDLTGGNNA
jgi:GntR family transcriptional regulator